MPATAGALAGAIVAEPAANSIDSAGEDVVDLRGAGRGVAGSSAGSRRRPRLGAASVGASAGRRPAAARR